MKRFQVHEDETGWGGYLVDKDAAAALPLLGKRAVLAVARDDPDIVEEGWHDNRTIITSNGRDFVRHIREFQRRQNNRQCRDLWGLVVIPNAQLSRKRTLESIRHGLDIQNWECFIGPVLAF